MKLKKKTRGRVKSGLALGAFVVLLAGARPVHAQNCINLSLDCSGCGGDVYIIPCCASASCFFVETSNGNCSRPAECTTECADGSIYDTANYCS